MKHASEEIRNMAVRLYKSGGYTYKEIGDIVGYSHKTIGNWVKADKEGRKQVPLERGHRQSTLTDDDLIRLKDLVESGEYHSANELVKAMGKSSKSGILRALHKMGYSFKKNYFCKSTIY